MKTPKPSKILPEYPATEHLPWKPNTNGDRIASEKDASIIFSASHVTIQEKADGANCGMSLFDGHPLIRSRTKFLRKGGFRPGANPSLAQFSSVFNWFHNNKKKFEKLNKELGSVSVYGEWMVQQHGMEYTNLPDWFVAFDVYDWESGRYLAPHRAIPALHNAGFSTVPLIGEKNILTNYEQLETFANIYSAFSPDKLVEGIYLKVDDGSWVTGRFKMVREGFIQGSLLEDKIKKNKISGVSDAM